MQTVANDTAITLAAASGWFHGPLLAHALVTVPAAGGGIGEDRRATATLVSTAHAAAGTGAMAQVFLAMTRGQETLGIVTTPTAAAVIRSDIAPRPRAPLLLIQPDAEETAAHERLLDAIARESKGQCLWLPKAPPAEPPAT